MPRTTSLVACGVQSPEHGRADTLLCSHNHNSEKQVLQSAVEVPGPWDVSQTVLGPTARPGPSVPRLVSRKAQSWLGVKSQPGYGILLLVAL